MAKILEEAGATAGGTDDLSRHWLAVANGFKGGKLEALKIRDKWRRMVDGVGRLQV
jgi:hypothetical protein